MNNPEEYITKEYYSGTDFYHNLLRRTRTFNNKTGDYDCNDIPYYVNGVCNGIRKHRKRMDSIITTLYNIVLHNKNYSKKYQVRGYSEYSEIKEYCDMYGIKCELIYDPIVKTNIVSSIHQTAIFDGNKQCPTKVDFYYSKEPVMYAKVSYKFSI